MTGQYRNLIALAKKQVLLLGSGDRLKKDTESLLQQALGTDIRLLAIDPKKFNALPGLEKFGLIVLGLAESASHVMRLLEKHQQGQLPPFLVIDYQPSYRRAVNSMRLGAVDYLVAGDIDLVTLTNSLMMMNSQPADLASQFDATSEAVGDETIISDALAADVASVANESQPVNPQTQAPPESTGVLPQVKLAQVQGQTPAQSAPTPVPVEKKPESEPEKQKDPDELMANELERRYQGADHSQHDVDFSNLGGGSETAPFSGAWLSMPDEAVDAAWPFSAQDMADGKARLGRYEILEFLGVGGMASVFKARDPDSDQLYAIKLLDPTTANDNVRERFKQEFELLRKIKHKHVVALLEQVEAQGSLFTVMEYLPGGDLKSRIRRKIKRTDAIRYTAQIAAGLHAAHEQNILHRDLKPANILFRSDGSLALVDFGVAKALDDKEKALTREGQMVGTPYYASPEQATGAKVDRRCDLYALGVILYEMIEGKRPYVGETSVQVMMAHVRKPVPMLSQEWDVLNDVLPQLMAKSPADRLSTGQEVVEVLNQACPGDVPQDLLK